MVTNDMKKFRNKLNKSPTTFLAYCGIVKACRGQRNLQRGLPAVIGIVIPENADIEVYEKAARLIATSNFARVFDLEDDRSIVIGRKCKGSSKSNDASLTAALRDYAQVLVVAEALEALPSDFAIMADAIVHVEKPTPEHISAACRLCLNEKANKTQAEFISALPFPIIAAGLRRGRSIAASIERMKLAIEHKTETPRSNSAPTLEDLHGLGEACEWGKQLAVDLADWRSGKIQWSEVDRGLLLSGPPGTGKTTFAAALARSCDAHLVLGSVARWQSQGHLGEMLKAMRKTFEEAKANVPSVVFLDEIDAIGDREHFDGHNRQYSTEVVSALLECMDGVEGREGVVVVGACNQPALIDAALTRPGRFDRHLRIQNPDHEGRHGILRWHLRNDLCNCDLEQLCKRTEGWSGASLEMLVRNARRSARRSKRPLFMDDLIGALPALLPVPARVRHRAAIHEAGHAVVGLVLGVGKLEKITILEHFDPTISGIRQGGGAVFQGEQVQERLRDQYLDGIALSLGGMAAEDVILGCRSAGAGGREGSDLHQATMSGLRMEASYGLGNSFQYRSSDEDRHLFSLLQQDSDLRRLVDATLNSEFRRAKMLIVRHRKAVEEISQRLLQLGEVAGSDIERLVLASNSKGSRWLRLITQTVRGITCRGAADPVLGASLDFLEADIQTHPERLQAFDGALRDRLEALVGDVEVDLDSTLSADDE
ncbi:MULTISPECIES: type II toxin-antitoxin system PrlF family antitoxin [unclassified Mesorhizobium]|uniref:type II toxin-antitoxin system PrlF family antitoxin n=1 Tax=unclassified Mesorhizobium TaxID=325217 RepID=UPI0030150C41